MMELNYCYYVEIYLNALKCFIHLVLWEFCTLLFKNNCTLYLIAYCIKFCMKSQVSSSFSLEV